MSNIDEIMGAIGRHGDDCIRDGDAASESFDGLREMIAAALADAERNGAEAMREAAQATPSGIDERGIPTVTVWQIRALPLPTSKRQAVRLTDEQILSAMWAAEIYIEDSVAGQARASGRCVEAAVLAANGLEVRRG